MTLRSSSHRSVRAYIIFALFMTPIYVMATTAIAVAVGASVWFPIIALIQFLDLMFKVAVFCFYPGSSHLVKASQLGQFISRAESGLKR